MNQEINRDYIGVVKENDGVYSYERIDIQKSDELLNKLKAMANNPNRTVLDLQECFEMHFKHSKKQAYDCCLPYSYSSSYIGCVCYPQMLRFDEYKAGKRQIEEQIRRRYAESGPFINQAMMPTEIAQEEKRYEEQLKSTFLTQAIRYVEAVDFTATSSKLKEQPTIRMMSHEKIGWKEILYKISKDLDIKVMTNFGYGSSSYFFVNVCYKGIDLLPYSQLVRYYYAQMADIIAYTRSYNTERESWLVALDFVADIGNRTQQGDSSFAHNWLEHEITEMLEGLNKIRQNPKRVLEDVKDRKIKSDGLCSVRNLFGNDLERYQIYPEELAIVFKAEKITNALRFIDKLQKAKTIYQPAEDAIRIIQHHNREIASEIEENIEKIHREIDELQAQLDKKNIELDVCSKAIMKHEEALDTLYEKNPDTARQKIRQAYAIQFPEYTRLQEEQALLERTVSKLERNLYYRRNFMTRLQQCHTHIAEAGLLAA